MVDGIVVAIQGVHGLQLFKGHAAFSAITLFSGFGPLELGAGGLLKKKSRVLAFHQLLDFIIKALDGSILRQFSLTDEINQQRLNSGVVLGLCAGQGQFNRIADFQILQFSGVIRVLLLVIGLKLCDLILKGLGVTRSLLQRFKLGVTLFDGVLGGGQFGVDLIEPGLGDEGTVQALHNLCGLFFSQAPFQQLFFSHCCYLQNPFLPWVRNHDFPGSVYRPPPGNGENGMKKPPPAKGRGGQIIN